ncbi:MAG: beta-ketoacyl-ACP synthase 3 [Gammaproteobacteria bacterium]|nr:beta-ketoacyl-ACP synthase 3 [Gammaproteobacteria bacterium]
MRTVRHAKIIGTGKYVPSNIISSFDLDLKLDKPTGWVAQKSGVIERRFATTETASFMGAEAAKQALEQAKISIDDVDCIIAANALKEQGIPANCIFILDKLNPTRHDITALDIDSTCLSFISAMNIASSMIELKIYRKILIVSSEMPSLGLDWADMETCTIFGDGAAAVVLSVSESSEKEDSHVIACDFRTHTEGKELCQVLGLGTGQGRPFSDLTKIEDDHNFKMQGKKVFKLASEKLPSFLDCFLDKAECHKEDIHIVIPHQASGLGLLLVQQRLGFADNKFMNIIATHGNQVAASIPTALHEALRQNKIKRGDKVLLLGTGAGFAMGLLLFKY